MMGGDSSIYSRDGVGGRRMPAQRQKRQGEPKLPKKSLRVLLLFFFAGFLFLLSALPLSVKLVDDPQARGKEQTDCFGR